LTFSTSSLFNVINSAIFFSKIDIQLFTLLL
jgi:hypothetical protein